MRHEEEHGAVAHKVELSNKAPHVQGRRLNRRSKQPEVVGQAPPNLRLEFGRVGPPQLLRIRSLRTRKPFSQWDVVADQDLEKRYLLLLLNRNKWYMVVVTGGIHIVVVLTVKGYAGGPIVTK